MKTATIQHAAGDGTWESAYGLMYSYELHLSNGEHIKVNANTGFIVVRFVGVSFVAPGINPAIP